MVQQKRYFEQKKLMIVEYPVFGVIVVGPGKKRIREPIMTNEDDSTSSIFNIYILRVLLKFIYIYT